MVFHEKENAHINQVTLKVRNLDKALDFYQKILGFRVYKQTSDCVQLSAGEAEPLMVLDNSEEVEPLSESTTGLYHFALLLPEKADLADFTKHLLEQNVPIASSDHLVSEAIYFSDPEGNGIEVYIDRPSSMWNWEGGEVQMAVEPLDFEELFRFSNPSGWVGLPERTMMGHIHLHVSDLEESKRFYCDGLGFDIVSRLGNDALFISTAGYHHHIGLNTWKGRGATPPSEEAAGLMWFDIHYPEPHSRQTAIERLEQMGAWIERENGVIYVKDPSQNTIRLLL